MLIPRTGKFSIVTVWRGPNLKLKTWKKVIMNRIQCFDDHFSHVNTNFKNSFCDQTPTCLRWIIGDKCFRQHRKRTWHVLIKIKILLFQLFKVYKQLWAVFTSIRKLDCVWSGNKRKTVWRRKIQTQNWLKEEDTNTKLAEGGRYTQNQNQVMHPKCPPFLHQFLAWTWHKFSYFISSKVTVGIKFTCITSLIHTLSDKVGFVNNTKTEPEEVFTSKHRGSTQSRGS